MSRRPLEAVLDDRIRTTLKAARARQEARGRQILGAQAAALRQQLLVQDAPDLVLVLRRELPALPLSVAFARVSQEVGLSVSYLQDLYYRHRR
jgi:hypothetical protein